MNAIKTKHISLLLVGLALLLVCLAPPDGQAQGPNQVGLVVQMGDGSYLTRCVTFGEPQISGYDVLLRSGLALEVSAEGGMGAFICGIEGEGCPADDCMCDYPPNYWSYWHLVEGQWVYSQMGAVGYMVNPGDVEGWRWGAGDPLSVVIPLDQICAPPATDTPTPTPTWTPSPTPTFTPTPTQTPLPTSTPTPLPPTATFTPSATPPSVETEAPTATALPPTATPQPTAPPPTAAVTATAAPPSTATATAANTPAPPSPSATPSPTPSSTPTASPTVTPLPTRVAVVTRAPVGGAIPTSPTPAAQETPGIAARLPALLAVGAGFAYLAFIFFLVLLGGVFVIVKLKQR